MAKRDDERQRKVLDEARTRFQRCENWEATWRARSVDDEKFGEGDSDNLYQWPEDIRNRMEQQTKPMLTVNKTKQHCLDILNDARQSRVAIKIRAVGDGASFDSAEVYNGVVRHIEYNSNAATAYQTGLKAAVMGGAGYWRIVTDYANDDSFDQEIFIRRIKDPRTVYLDPDINEFDGSDSKFGFIATSMPRQEWDLLHPNQTPPPAMTALAPGQTFVREDRVISCEYFRRITEKDELIAYQLEESGEETTKIVRASELDPKLVKLLKAQSTTKVRKITSSRVEWFKIEGDEIVDDKDWPGVYIPIVRCIGEETVIDGELDRKGHVRALKDPQRMFNYNASGSIEFGALQSRTPYIAPADSIEGYETEWGTANTENYAYLLWNHRDDEGEEIPPPQRQQPPVAAPVFMEGMMNAAEWMRMVSGQYQSDMGAPSNERSGVAIAQRQRQGDNATFHFLDHQAIAIRFTGKILIDLIPKVYDTERVLKMQGDEGEETAVTIDPDAQEALQKRKKSEDEVETIFNPSVGKYDVESDVGPAFATKRQEAFNAFTQLLSQNQQLAAVIGDIMLRAGDFPGAEEAAERLKRMVPKQALEDGPSPDLQAAQQQIEAMQNLVKQLAQKLADKEADHKNDEEKLAVDAYKAQSDRIKALSDALQLDPEGLIQLVRQVIEEAMITSGPGLMPALTPTPEITDQTVMGQPPQQPPMMNGGAPPFGVNANPDDMGTGPPQAESPPLE